MGELNLKKTVSGGGIGGKIAKTVRTATGALVGGVSKEVLFSGGATFIQGYYTLTAYNPLDNSVVLCDTLIAGDDVDTPNSPKTRFTIMVAVDLPAGLIVVATGS